MTIRTDNTVGSGHFPVFSDIGGKIQVSPKEVNKKWSFNKGKWTKFQKVCKERIDKVESDGVHQMNNLFIEVIIAAAQGSILTSKG